MIETSLLWKAWPDGYLATPGVTTQGGWVTTEGEAEAQTIRWVHPGGQNAYSHHGTSTVLVHAVRSVGWPEWLHSDCGNIGTRILDENLLLPRVDPRDTATWACLLADLAGAVERRTEYRFAIDRGLIFNLHPTLTNRAVLEGWGKKFEWEILPTRDVALALVLCRIFEREHEASNPTVR